MRALSVSLARGARAVGGAVRGRCVSGFREQSPVFRVSADLEGTGAETKHMPGMKKHMEHMKDMDKDGSDEGNTKDQ